MKKSKLFFLLFTVLFLNSVYSGEKKQHWEHVADSVIAKEYKSGCAAEESVFVKKFIKTAIENRRFDDSTRLFGDPSIPDDVWIHAFEFEYSQKIKCIEGRFLDNRLNISDTENVRIGYPFKVYFSSEGDRAGNYNKNTPVRKILCPDSPMGKFGWWLFPLWYKNATVGMCEVSSCDSSKYCYCKGLEERTGESFDQFSEIRTAWPLSKGYNPVIIAVYKDWIPYDYFFHIPQLDSLNLAPLRIFSRNFTDEEKARVDAIGNLRKSEPNKIPVLGYRGRYKKLSTVYEELINLK